MIEPRKASDILIGLEAEVKSLKATVNLQEVLLKTILGNCNKANAMLSALIDAQPLTVEQREVIRLQFEPKAPIAEAVDIPKGFPVEVEREFKGERRVSRPPSGPSTKASNTDIEFKDYMAARKKTTPQELKAPAPEQAVKAEKRVPVTQRVQDNNKKDLFMAVVDLMSVDGTSAVKTKTNAMGKWQAQLAPGKYIVKISKMDTASQKKLENQQDIVVPNSDSPVVLSTLIINRE